LACKATTDDWMQSAAVTRVYRLDALLESATLVADAAETVQASIDEYTQTLVDDVYEAIASGVRAPFAYAHAEAAVRAYTPPSDIGKFLIGSLLVDALGIAQFLYETSKMSMIGVVQTMLYWDVVLEGDYTKYPNSKTIAFMIEAVKSENVGFVHDWNLTLWIVCAAAFHGISTDIVISLASSPHMQITWKIVTAAVVGNNRKVLEFVFTEGRFSHLRSVYSTVSREETIDCISFLYHFILYFQDIHDAHNRLPMICSTFNMAVALRDIIIDPMTYPGVDCVIDEKLYGILMGVAFVSDSPWFIKYLNGRYKPPSYHTLVILHPRTSVRCVVYLSNHLPRRVSMSFVKMKPSIEYACAIIRVSKRKSLYMEYAIESLFAGDSTAPVSLEMCTKRAEALIDAGMPVASLCNSLLHHRRDNNHAMKLFTTLTQRAS